MVILLPKMAMVSDCDGAGIAAVCKERKRRLRHARLHYIQCFQVINIHYSSAANSNSYFLFLLPPLPAFGSECILHILLTGSVAGAASGLTATSPRTPFVVPTFGTRLIAQIGWRVEEHSSKSSRSQSQHVIYTDSRPIVARI